MIRTFVGCFILGSLIGFLIHAPGAQMPLGLAFGGIGVALRFAGQRAGTIAPSKCPFCRKRVKLGAAPCHHCGRQLAQA